MLGLPVALIIAWAFEAHPEGVRRTQPSARPPPRFRTMDWVLVAATLAIVGVFTVQATGLWSPPWRKGGDRPQAAAAAEKSIAVLPFANFSGSKDAEYFADGLTEEVINSLAKTPDLKVAGRTSAFYYKDRNADLRQVGRQLGVAHVLEGSIRREGERIRVTAQLIKVSDGFHMWSETYDRDLKDAFAVQTEIADNVAGVLKTKLLASSEAAGDADAYRLLLIARGRLRDLGLQNTQAAQNLYRRAIKLDPNSAEAHAGLAQATVLLAQNYMVLNFDQARREAEAEIARAVAIDPRSVPAYLASGFLNATLTRRVGDPRFARRSEAAYRRALEIDPRNPDVLTYYGSFLVEKDRPQEAVPILKRGLEIDPLNRLTLSTMAAALGAQGKIDEAAQAYRSVVALYPDFVDAPEHLGGMLAKWGRLDEAEPWLRRAARSSADPSASVRLAHLYLNLGMNDDARAALARAGATESAAAIVRAINYITAKDYRGLMNYTQAQYAKDHDPFWPSAILVAAVHLDDPRTALAQTRIIAPDLLGPDPEVNTDFSTALATAHSLNRLGLKDQAGKILQGVLTAATPSPGQRTPPDNLVYRARAYAELGDRARALAELRRAVAEGCRSLVDFEDFVRMEDSPSFQTLRDDPEFRAILARIGQDNARMRARVLASRAGGQQT
jgi:TolB-like protein/Tfp pilus assembly protein PilF